MFNKSSNISRLSLLLLFQIGGGNMLVPEHAFLSVICRECCPFDRDVNWRPCSGRVIPCAVKESNIQTYSRTSACGRTYLGVVYRITAFVKKKKKKKKNKIPPYPPYYNFFGVVTLNTHIFYLALLNMRNTLKKWLN